MCNEVEEQLLGRRVVFRDDDAMGCAEALEVPMSCAVCLSGAVFQMSLYGDIAAVLIQEAKRMHTGRYGSALRSRLIFVPPWHWNAREIASATVFSAPGR